MTRFKNPKPQKQQARLQQGGDLAVEENDALLTQMHENNDEDAERSTERSLSPSSKRGNVKQNVIVSVDMEDNPICEESDEHDTEQHFEEREKQDCSDQYNDTIENTIKQEISSEESFLSDRPRRYASSPSNLNILSWLQKRFVLRDNAKTSAAQVIKLYEKEFTGEDFVPLQSYQVGQLLRRIFPNLQRCKITIGGKRVWVYKHLCVKGEETLHSKMTANKGSRKNNFIADTENEGETSSDRNLIFSTSGERKHVKNSAILYNLLHPRINDSRHSQSTTFRKVSSKSSTSQAKHPLPKSCRDESIIQWLRDNYEYADGYYVKSLNVLKKYNQGHQTEVRYLSQVGRIIKYVFPNARHLRRSLKGGKREWVYHNIRPKDHTENDIWKGSRKNLSPQSSISFTCDSRPSMVPITKLPLSGSSKLETDEENFTFLQHHPRFHPSPEELVISNRERISGRNAVASLPTRSYRVLENSAFKSEITSSNSSPNSAPNLSEAFGSHRPSCEKSAQEFCEGPLRSCFVNENTENGVTSDSLSAPIPRLSLKLKRTNETLQEAYIMNGKNLGSFSEGEGQAEDLSVNFFDKKMEEDSEGAANPDASSSSQQLDHNYTYSRVVDSDLRVKDYLKPDDVSRPTPVLESEESLQNHNSIPESLLPHNPPNETLQWEDLSMCDAHRYGWTLTPNLNNEIPSNYIEWVLFEGQLLRDGQRVFRELKIYDDWTVAIHAMGKKVHPDELGGITDLSRTRKSVTKVFATLAGARSCRGCPALSLSDLSVHGVVVAKTEIWSSRENNCEELRHRAINCQVLYCGNEESCPKCTRVIQMHSQNASNPLGYNCKESRFIHRPNTSV